MNKYLIVVSVIVVTGGAIIGGLYWLGANVQQESAATGPAEMFQNMLFDPIPAEVRDIQGTAELRQGHTVFLSFSIEPAFLSRLISLHNYQESDCGYVLTRLMASTDQAWKSQLDTLGTIRKCYRSPILYANQWTQAGSSVFVFDVKANKVLFNETGM